MRQFTPIFFLRQAPETGTLYFHQPRRNSMIPFTVLRRFSGSDYSLPDVEEQDKPDRNSKEEQPYFTILSSPKYPGFDSSPSAA